MENRQREPDNHSEDATKTKEHLVRTDKAAGGSSLADAASGPPLGVVAVWAKGCSESELTHRNKVKRCGRKTKACLERVTSL